VVMHCAGEWSAAGDTMKTSAADCSLLPGVVEAMTIYVASISNMLKKNCMFKSHIDVFLCISFVFLH